MLENYPRIVVPNGSGGSAFHQELRESGMVSSRFKQSKYHVFKFVNHVLAEPFKRRLGRLAILRPVRDLFFRPSGIPETIGRWIEFEGRRLYFTAPYQILLHAEKSGIESRLCRVILAQCDMGAVCVDIGASYGFITIIMGLAVRPKGKVLSFEPVPSIYAAVNENIKANQLTEVCEIFPVALGASSKILHLSSAGTTYEVPSDTLDNICRTQSLERLDVVKIDTDGADYDVLRGAETTLRRFHPILIVEMERRQREIYQMVKDFGYLHILDMDGRSVIPDKWPPNLIAAMHRISIPPRGSLSRPVVLAQKDTRTTDIL